MEGFCQKSLSVESFLWYFFSGYGLNYQNKEYLMSMYGNPQEYETIGISIINLTEYFIKSLVEYMLVMLDIKHNCFIRIEN